MDSVYQKQNGLYCRSGKIRGIIDIIGAISKMKIAKNASQKEADMHHANPLIILNEGIIILIATY